MNNKHFIYNSSIVFFLILSSISAFGQALEERTDIRRIWDRAPHNAFTDITFFRNRLYVVLREGDGHTPAKDGTGNGAIRVLSSADGEFWESTALIKLDGVDLRDPKISVTPKKRLLVLMGGAAYENGEAMSISTYFSTSDPQGKRFADPERVELDEDLQSDFDWIWRVTWYEKSGYGVLYQTNIDGEKGKSNIYLVKTGKGSSFELITELNVDGNPNEATIRFAGGGEMLMLVRREGDDKMGLLGSSQAPYTDWSWQKLDFRLGGPNFDIIPINKLLIATRMYDDNGNYTALLLGKKGEPFREVMRLPSGGDTSYAGMFSISGFVWLSYYSSHEGKTAVYYARIPYSALQ
jgi:hypothetical protein